MPETEIYLYSASELSGLIRARDLSPVEVVDSYLGRISALNEELRAFVYIDTEGARQAAREAEAALLAGDPLGALHGVPVAYKDIYDVRGMPTTAGSRVLLDNVARDDCAVAARLRAAGAICLGKLNTFEFASGSMEVFGNARNPWDLARSPGGSSAGSGTALAARMIPLATGSDTGGSIRIPASFCGLAGLRPTHGLTSKRGVIPLSWSLDSVGPMARTVRDVALMLHVMAGHDPGDPSSIDRPVPDYLSAVDSQSSRPWRVGIPRQFFFDENNDPEVVSSVRECSRVLESAGATIHEVDLPSARFGLAASWAIAYGEAYAYHRDTFMIRARDYTSSFLLKISAAGLLGVDEYLTGQRIRERVTQEFTDALQVVDVILTPTTPYPAFGFDDSPPQDMGRLTRPISLAGLPALAIPCGFTDAGLPVSAQIIGPAWGDALVLRVGQLYEMLTNWHERTPTCVHRSESDRAATSSTPPSAGAVTWVRDAAALRGLTYLSDDEHKMLAALIEPMSAGLAEARDLLASTDEPAVRPAP